MVKNFLLGFQFCKVICLPDFAKLFPDLLSAAFQIFLTRVMKYCDAEDKIWKSFFKFILSSMKTKLLGGWG